MHLLPQSFGLLGDLLLLPGSSIGSATLLLPVADRFFSKACRTSSRGRLFRFVRPLAHGIEATHGRTQRGNRSSVIGRRLMRASASACWRARGCPLSGAAL